MSLKRDSFSTPAQAKDLLRRTLRDKLRALTPEQHGAASQEICRRVADLPAFRLAKTVALFAPLPTEPNIHPLIEQAWAEGKRVALPLMVKSEIPQLHWHRVNQWDGIVVTSSFGLREPDPIRCPRLKLAELDCVFVPGLAFDNLGNRLGRGGGFYDSFLTQAHPRTTCIGLMFECQRVELISNEPHDQKLKWITTEKGLWEATR